MKVSSGEVLSFCCLVDNTNAECCGGFSSKLPPVFLWRNASVGLVAICRYCEIIFIVSTAA